MLQQQKKELYWLKGTPSLLKLSPVTDIGR